MNRTKTDIVNTLATNNEYSHGEYSPDDYHAVVSKNCKNDAIFQHQRFGATKLVGVVDDEERGERDRRPTPLQHTQSLVSHHCAGGAGS